MTAVHGAAAAAAGGGGGGGLGDGCYCLLWHKTAEDGWCTARSS